MIQGSPEWFAAKCGKVSASRIGDLTAKTKTDWGASRKNYMAQIILERLTGTVAEGYTNAAMLHGTETEPQARAAYEFMTNNDVEEIGLVYHPHIPFSLASPDGLIGDDGVLEIKCPNSATHLETLLGSPIDRKYICQVQWQMACTGRKWADFVSFDPRFPADLQIKITRILCDDIMIKSLENDVSEFLVEVSEKMTRLKNLDSIETNMQEFKDAALA